MPVKSIELDCAPGGIRPGDLIEGVLEGTGLTAKKPVAMLFGQWTWVFPEVSDEEWKKVQEITKPRIEALYHKGFIRYGSW
jgi:hypothetical protein